MKRLSLLVFAILALTIAASASASSQKQWFTHFNGHGKLVCDKGNNGVTGPFVSKAACEASLSDGGGDGGGNGGGDVPTGWPGTTGTISGDASGACGDPVVLTSDETAPGFGAFDFDITPGQTFSQIGLQFDFDILSGTQAQSEPYMIVRFTDGTQAFVYSVDVNPGEAGDQTYSLDGNTYLTRDEAMNEAGTKVVSSVTLAVDNGNLSIEAHGLTVDGSCVTASSYEAPASVFLCYSAFQTDPGVWIGSEADGLVAGGYWEASAVAGNVDGAANIGGYHLVCNSGLAPTGGFLSGDGSVYGSDYGPALEELGFYPIVG
jgi:hypothetical protein